MHGGIDSKHMNCKNISEWHAPDEFQPLEGARFRDRLFSPSSTLSKNAKDIAPDGNEALTF